MTQKSKLKARPPEESSTGHTKQLLFGPSGVGKTWFATSFPKPYYLDTEGGAKLAHYRKRIRDAGGVILGPGEGTLDFPTVLGEMETLATERHEYRTLIIDSITKLYQTAISREAEKLGDKDAFGASKKPAIAFMRRMVAWIDRLDMNVLLIAHETSEWGVDGKGNRMEIGKMADVWDKLPYELDLSLWCQKRGPKRVAIVRKSRLLGFPESESFELDYSQFAERYGKDFIEAEAKPIILASPELIQDINALLETVRVDEDFIAKCLSRAGVESLPELNADQAERILHALQKKLPSQK